MSIRERHTMHPAALLGALAAGLSLFFVVESAVARRVGLDLFLPVEAGVFLPGRLARLAACLVVGFALAMTERGRSVSRALDRFCGRDRGRWIVSAAVTALFFLWTLRVTVMAYMTMDEVTYMQVIARIPKEGMWAVRNSLSHTAMEGGSALSVLLCWLIGIFYCIDPDGLWYLGYHLVMLLVSCAIIGRCMLVKTSRRGWPVWAGCALFGAMCAGVFFYAFSRVAFSVTASMVGSASAALILCRHHESTRAGRVRCDIASAVLIVLCCMQRRATGYCLLCFWALAVAYQLLRLWLAGDDGRKKRILAFGLCAVVSLGLVGGVFASAVLESDEHYREAEHYRALIGDYLIDELTDEQFARAGVEPELAALIRTWYFMDERITTDLFRELSEIYYADLDAQPAQPILSRLCEIAADLADTLWYDQQKRWQAIGLLVLLALSLVNTGRYGRRYWPEAACAVCAAGGTGILLMYLIRAGRFPAQAFLTISVPAAVILALMALSAPEPLPETVSSGASRRRAAIPAAVLLCVLAVCCVLSMHAVPHAAEAATRDSVFARQQEIEAFADANSDKTIVSRVYDHSDANTDPFHPLSAYPENLIEWGYCGTLAKDPEDRLYSEDLFRDDVLFMTDDFISPLLLLQYLTLDFGPVQAELIDEPAANITVYKLSRVDPGQDYTGWYEQNGLTYYFRDGQAVTGEQIIDGEHYSFAPAGSAAGFITVPGATRIHSTNAYSLLSPEDDA